MNKVEKSSVWHSSFVSFNKSANKNTKSCLATIRNKTKLRMFALLHESNLYFLNLRSRFSLIIFHVKQLSKVIISFSDT